MRRKEMPRMKKVFTIGAAIAAVITAIAAVVTAAVHFRDND